MTSRPPVLQPAARTTSITRVQGTEGSVVYDLERMCEVQVYFKADADKDNGRDCGFRTYCSTRSTRLQVLPAGRRHRDRLDDMKTLQAHALMQAMHGGEYICNFEMGARLTALSTQSQVRSVRHLGKVLRKVANHV